MPSVRYTLKYSFFIQVPFGEVKMVQEWLGITGEVLKPPNEHPKKPVWGFQCPRSEVGLHCVHVMWPIQFLVFNIYTVFSGNS